MILVTGVSGFIGKHLLTELIASYGAKHVLALTSKPIAECAYLLHHDYQFDKDYFVKSGYSEISTIVHAGAFTPKTSGEANDIEKSFSNISSLRTLLSSSLPLVDKFVFLSTLDVYEGDGIITESSPVNPISLYGQSKLYGEKMIEAWGTQQNKRIQILRIGHVYGPGEEGYQKIIPATLKKIMRGLPVEIWGEGSEIRSFVYVKDVVKAIVNSIAMIENPGVINIMGEESITVNDLVRKLVSLSDPIAEIEHKPLVTIFKGRDLRFDVSKLRRYLLTSQTALELGLAEEWKYMKGRLK